ncbi:MAG: DUF2202 domain-containing protein [Sulfurovaceae bacterium]|nr:DUF2202 domain-containing protein [Sulfurovaceae bacterium]
MLNNQNQDRRDFISKLLVVSVGVVGLVSSGEAARKGGSGGTTTLTSEQKDHLLFIYQEEKVARDVYITLGKVYPSENTFANIQLSEQRHMDAARNLCVKYGVNITGIDESVVGQFILPPLQELYNTCIYEGKKSQLNAVKIGELIEITDIKDLQEASIGMPTDVVNVYSNLEEGSYNHLEAFQTAIKRLS